jgi:hypothetical protein
VLKIAMTMHHYLHSPLQKNLWSSNTGPMLFSNSSMSSPCRHPFWCSSLRTTIIISTVTAIILHSIGRIISVGGGDGWGRGVHNRRRSSFNVGGDILLCLFFFIGVDDDDDVAVARWPKKLMIEFAEETSRKLLTPRNVGEDFFLVERKIHHRDRLEGPVVLTNW